MTVKVTYTPPSTLKVQPTGAPGLSAYAVAVGEGYSGTVEEWLASLVGPTGASAYEAAVEEGFVGDQAAWVASLAGADGQSAYEVAVANGFVGDQAAWLASLIGPEGPTAVSTDAGNVAALGTDSLIYVPTPTPAPVDSVNAQTGAVVLDAADVGAAAAAHEHPAAEISDATVTGRALVTAVDAAAARAAIGAGTGSSDFDGAYSSLSGTPTLGTAAAAAVGDFATAAQGSTADSAVQPGDLGTAAVLDVPATGDAAAGEVVKGDDSRLTDARTPAAHGHTVSDVTDAGTAASADVTDFATAAQGGLADSAVQPADLGGAAVLDVGTTAGTVAAGDDARIVAGGTAVQPGDLAAVATSGAYADLSGGPTLGTAAALDVPATGDAAAGEVVLGSDSRLGGGGASALDDLSDVDLTTTAPTDQQALVYDVASSKWVPGDVAAGGGSAGLEVCYAVATGTQSLTNNVFTTLSYGSSSGSGSGWWSAGDPTKITAPADGDYLLTVRAGHNGTTSATEKILAYSVNGGGASWFGREQGGSGQESTGSAVVSLSAGDYVQASFYQSTGGTRTTVDSKCGMTLVRLTGGGGAGLAYSADLGAVTAETPVTVTHNLGTLDVVVQVVEKDTAGAGAAAGTVVDMTAEVVDANSVALTFTNSAAANLYRVTVLGSGGTDTGISANLIDAKGDLIAGSAADTAARLAVGTDGQVLTADSAEATGLKWGPATQTYTPALTASTTDPTLGTGGMANGRYWRIGPLVFVDIQIKFGTSGADAGSGGYRISLPVTPRSPDGTALALVGQAHLYDDSAVARAVCQAMFVDGTSWVNLRQAAAAAWVTNSSPWTFAANDALLLSLVYEAA